MSIEEVLGRLDEYQRPVTSKTSGIHLTLAGPGTGKTATQTAHIANLVHQGVAPDQILAITFTNQAAAESKSRIVKHIGQEGWQVAASTYHSFCRKHILKPNESHDLFKSKGYKNGFIILDETDSKTVMKDVLKGVSGGVKMILECAQFKERNVLDEISKHRAQGVTIEQFFSELKQNLPLISEYQSLVKRFPASLKNVSQDTLDDFEKEVKQELARNPDLVIPAIATTWKRYATNCAEAGGIDFDDQLLYSLELLREDPSIARRLAGKFTYIFLDEHQDSNPCQWEIITSIINQVRTVPNLFIVGDDKQSIYAFRSADVSIMQNLPKQYNGVETHFLRNNYRSTQPIIDLFNLHALNMTGKIGDGQLVSGTGMDGPIPSYIEFNSDRQEAEWVVEDIKAKLAKGVPAEDIAVLYRGRSQNVAIKDALSTHKVDYEIIGDIGFYETAEVKAVTAALRALIRDRDIFAFSKLLDHITIGVSAVRLKTKHHESIGTPLKVLHEIVDSDKRAAKKGRQFLEVFGELSASVAKLKSKSEFLASVFESTPQAKTIYNTSPEKAAVVDQIYTDTTAKSLQAFRQAFIKLWDDYIYPEFEKAEKKKAASSNQEIDDEQQDKLSTRLQNMLKVLSRVIEEVSEGEPFSEVVDDLVQRVETNHKDSSIPSIQLLTNHASKGKEFKHLYLVACEDESYFREDNPSSETIEEEGRNFYVALTRAERDLTVSCCSRRMVNGMDSPRTPLRFIAPIQQKMLTEEQSYYAKQQQQGSPVESELSDNDRLTMARLKNFGSGGAMCEPTPQAKPQVTPEPVKAETVERQPLSASIPSF
ncbi:ATP-dependent helicase [Shewanella marisflavi]|uniref:ATP-dependent helicase n=1 Tax=Shewanella marisflavi TaxID=260364 RepID=UPI003AAC87BC